MSAEPTSGTPVATILINAVDAVLAVVGLVRKKKAEADAKKGHAQADRVEERLSAAGFPPKNG